MQHCKPWHCNIAGNRQPGEPSTTMASARGRPKPKLLVSVGYARKTSVLDIKMRSISFRDGGIPMPTTRTCFDLTCDTQELPWSETSRLSSPADSASSVSASLRGSDCDKTKTIPAHGIRNRQCRFWRTHPSRMTNASVVAPAAQYRDFGQGIEIMSGGGRDHPRPAFPATESAEAARRNGAPCNHGQLA